MAIERLNPAHAADLGTFATLMSAPSVSNADWIVGWGLTSSWAYRGFLLRPNE